MTATDPIGEHKCGPCGVCGSSAVDELVEYRALRRVTSDCRPWPAGGRLGICTACGAVQKPADARFLEEIAAIYDAYAIYHQAQGAEQAVFEQTSGLPASRSVKLIETFFSRTPLPTNGRVLDVGCGNGATLRAFARVAPGWRLAGTELNDKYRRDVEAIPNAEPLHVGPVETLSGTFDVITLIHALEHMVEPVSFLRSLTCKLKPGGMLLIEVPHHPNNAFELLIADHRSHFSAHTIAVALVQAGYEAVTVATDWIAKELSVVARPRAGTAARASASGVEPAAARRVLEHSLRWLGRVADAARSQAAGRPIGLFGTSIAGTWLAGELGDALGFFVDEDPNRIGKRYLDRPILSPTDVPAGSSVFVGLPPAVAAGICGRLQRPGMTYLPPPA